jgi:dTDP-4-dehydrorhamnose 3,5-epimerase-like enzyme
MVELSQLHILRTIPAKIIQSETGILRVSELHDQENFACKRFYTISKVSLDANRGSHAHKKLDQVFFSARGSFLLKVTNGIVVDEVVIEENGYGYFLPRGYWRDLSNFSEGAICVVLASEFYDENDYIYSFEDFLIWKKYG